MQSLNEQARQLKAAHHNGVLVLPNAWDGASAALAVDAGATAVATTSGGVAWSLGGGDGQRLQRSDMLAAAQRIAQSVDVPVTFDIEGGYGPAPAEVEATVSASIVAGAAGINLEDSTAAGNELFSPEEQARRLRAARYAAVRDGVPVLVINARCDVYLLGIGAEAGQFEHVVSRALTYAEAGADCLFVPGLVDLETLTRLTGSVDIPVNAMAVPGGPTVKEFVQAGVCRVSVGTGFAQVAYGAAAEAMGAYLAKGEFNQSAQMADYGELQELLRE